MDERVERYAQVLVETCLDVQPGWQVLVLTSPLARPLNEAVAAAIARRGAYALFRQEWGGSGIAPMAWYLEASEELLRQLSPIEEHALRNADAFVQIAAPENTRSAAALSPERLRLVQGSVQPVLARLAAGEVAWVGCQYPTPALAQEAGMGTGEFEDFLYEACLRDWDAERERMRRYAERFERAGEVRIVGEGTDLRLSIAGRPPKIDAGGANLPGGEFFFSPVEDSAEGEISFGEFPAVYQGREVRGIRLRFEAGRVVDASAETEEAFLLETLDADEGSRRLGELGIGCNPGITRYMKNTLFDEKIDGTVHVALGLGFPDIGGRNVSRVHWDLVKDLRSSGGIHLDGEVVQERGAWRV